MLAVLYVKIQMFQHHLLKRMFPSRIAFDKHLLILYMRVYFWIKFCLCLFIFQYSVLFLLLWLYSKSSIM